MVRPGTGMSLAFVTVLSLFPAASGAEAQQTTLERIKRLGSISVCADPNRMPYSSDKEPAGFDLEVSREVAKELGVRLDVTWHSTHRGTKIVRQLAETKCDFFPGFPIEASFEEENFRVILTKPLYSSGFATMARADAPETILQDSKSKGVGVQMGTLPDFRLFDRGYERKLFRNAKEMVEALKHKEIDAAVVPALEAGWEIKSASDSSIKVLSNTEKDFVFPLAIAVRKSDKELRDLINGVIDNMEKSGKLKELFDKYGMVQLAGTGGGEAPKSKAEAEKEDGGKDDDGPPNKDKKSNLNAPNVKVTGAGHWWSWFVSPAAAEEPAAKSDAPKPDGKATEAIVPETGEDLGADDHGLALSPPWRVDTKTVEDFPSDDKAVDDGRKLYKQACYKCHGPNGVSGGTIPDLRKYAAKADHYEMFMVIQAGRLDLGMPAWNDYLTEDEIKKIIVYVKALHKK